MSAGEFIIPFLLIERQSVSHIPISLEPGDRFLITNASRLNPSSSAIKATRPVSMKEGKIPPVNVDTIRFLLSVFTFPHPQKESNEIK
ncbi:hypothetical protein WG66_015062 [Moniliophthora roreri]|nr:hypothetical protein WG66_015062 [Moniliophthora roreri]